MHDEIMTLERYLAAPGEALAITDFSQEAAECFAPLLSLHSEILFCKWPAVRNIAAVLQEKDYLRPFTLQMTPKLKPEAYMLDAGQIHLSLGLLMTRSALTILAVYCHELGHIRLSQRPDYPAIKAVQKEFMCRFRENPLCDRMSPIEFGAMLQSRSLLCAITDYTENAQLKKRLTRLTDDLDHKIRTLEREIIHISNP